MKKDFIVFSKRLSKALVAQGFILKDTQVNKKRPNYFVYLFEDTPELRERIKNITK